MKLKRLVKPVPILDDQSLSGWSRWEIRLNAYLHVIVGWLVVGGLSIVLWEQLT